jgi:hypothetical protein
MKTKFRVFASYRVFTHVDIDAENLAEAKEIAYNLDSGDFSGRTEYGDWDIENIVSLEDINKMFRKEQNE